MRQYIIATKKHPDYRSSVSEILEYGLYTGEKNSEGKYLYISYTKELFFKKIYDPSITYFSWNTRNNDTAELYKNERTLGKPFLQSKPTDTSTDNLLRLDDIP